MGSLHRAGSAPVDSVVAPSTTGRELIPLSQRLPPGHARAGAPRRLSGRRCSSTRCGNGARSARRRPEFVRSQFLDHGVRRSGELSGRSRRSWSVGPRTRAANSELWSAASSEESVAPDFTDTGIGRRGGHSRLEHHVGPGTVDEIDARHPDKRRDAHRHDHSRACGAAAADPSARREHSDERASWGAYLAGSWVEPTSTASTLTPSAPAPTPTVKGEGRSPDHPWLFRDVGARDGQGRSADHPSDGQGRSADHPSSSLKGDPGCAQGRSGDRHKGDPQITRSFSDRINDRQRTATAAPVAYQPSLFIEAVPALDRGSIR